jgi:hypothetical protein
MNQTATQPASIDNAFAHSESDIYADHPFYGALFRVRSGQSVFMQHVKQSERLTLSTFLEQKNISNGSFLLETDDKNGHAKGIAFQVDKNGELEPLNPFAGLKSVIAEPENTLNSQLKQEYEAQILKLRGKVSDLTDELVSVKRELGEDKTNLLLSHEKEKRELEKEKDNKIKELETEISELKTEVKFKELETRQDGDRSFGNRLLDILQSNISDDFLANLASNIGKLTGNATPPTQAQMQQALAQTAQAQQDVQPAAPTGEPENNPQTIDLSKFNTGEPAENPQGPPETPQDGPQTLQNVARQPISPQQIAQIKERFLQGLKDTAFEALTADNQHLKQYAHVVRSQMGLFKEQGITVDTQQWIQLTKMLANKAVNEEISPGRVAKVVNPLLANVPPQYRTMLTLLDSAKAANILFQSFNIEASPQVKGVVVKVLEVLKNNP